MAIPTDFKGYTPAAGATKSFKLLGSATVGLWVNDVDGTLSAGTKVIPLAADASVIMSAAYTDTAIAALLKDVLVRMGSVREGVGGQPTEAAKQIAVTATTCT